jgi:HEPN domain-containing protein
MPREDARTHLTRQWLTKANHDLRAAVLASGTEEELWDIAAFHSQQAAEKALKAFLAWHDVPFRRTHNLVELLEECEAVDVAFASLRAAAEFLTRFAIDPRYPGAASEPDVETLKDALQRARDMMLFVLSKLPEEVRP